jgi:hypothetical protein
MKLSAPITDTIFERRWTEKSGFIAEYRIPEKAPSEKTMKG